MRGRGNSGGWGEGDGGEGVGEGGVVGGVVEAGVGPVEEEGAGLGGGGG